MLVVRESFKLSDTGRQRRANEDAAFASAPLFAVADGMGGAQAGEIASGVAVSVLADGLPDGAGSVEERLASLVQDANAQIHDLSVSDADRAGMGTTMTTAYLGEADLSVAHVGDSRLYCLRDGELTRLTRDHSLVEELVQEGRLTPEEADEHPQRSIITRALGPEADVAVDRMTLRARDGDVYLLCSDGLTSMIPEAHVAELVARAHGAPPAALADVGRSLVRAANEAGGRDNVTVVLFRVADVRVGTGDDDGQATMVGAPAVSVPAEAGPQPATAAAGALAREEPTAEAPVRLARPAGPGGAGRAEVPRRAPRPSRVAAPGPRRRGRRARRVLKALAFVLVPLFVVVAGGYAAISSVYFVGADREGFVALYRGLPYDGPFGLKLYSTTYTSGATLPTLPAKVRSTVTDHKLRARADAGDLVSAVEQGRVSGQ